MLKIKKYIILFLTIFNCINIFAGAGDSIFKSNKVYRIDLNFNQLNPIDSLIFYKEKYFGKKYMQVNIKFENQVLYSCGIKIKGESSYEFTPGNKKSFKIIFDKYIKGQKIDGLDEINLVNGFKDPTFMREKIMLDLLNSEGLPAPRCNYANIFINGENYGLYLLCESIDKIFLKNRFGHKKGTLIKGEPDAYLEYIGDDLSKYRKGYESNNPLDNSFIDLVKAMNDTNISENNYPSQLDKIFNIDNCIKQWAIQNILLNTDAYNTLFPHNFYLFKDSETNKFEWISFDMNYSFCAWSPNLTYKQAVEFPALYNDHFRFKRPFRNIFLKNKIIKEKYISYINKILETKLTENWIKTETSNLKVLIDEFVKRDTLKMYSYEDFIRNIDNSIGDINDPGAFIPGLTSFFKERRLYLLKSIKD